MFGEAARWCWSGCAHHDRQVRYARQVLCDDELEGNVGQEKDKWELQTALDVGDGKGEDTEGETAEDELKEKKTFDHVLCIVQRDPLKYFEKLSDRLKTLSFNQRINQ